MPLSDDETVVDKLLEESERLLKVFALEFEGMTLDFRDMDGLSGVVGAIILFLRNVSGTIRPVLFDPAAVTPELMPEDTYMLPLRCLDARLSVALRVYTLPFLTGVELSSTFKLYTLPFRKFCGLSVICDPK